MIRRRRGLTLVELLMAVAIFAILGVGLSSHLRGATLAWRRAMEETEASQRLRVAMEQLERDLANATLFDGTGSWTPAPVFGSQELHWYTRRPGLRDGDPASVRYVAYALGADGALTRTSMTPQEAHAAAAQVEPSVLVRGVASLEVRYAVMEPSAGGGAATLSWLDDWESTEQLPGLVEVRLTMTESAAGPSAVRRAMRVPTGSLQRPESSG